MAASKPSITCRIKFKETTYHFLKIIQDNDGTLIFSLPHIKPSSKKITQVLRGNYTASEIAPSIVDQQPSPVSDNHNMYITYHTTGRVNYHDMSFSPNYMQPLVSLTKINPFFLLSFASLDCFTPVDTSDGARSDITIDLSECSEMRINAILSVTPHDFQPVENCTNIILVKYSPLYQVMIEFVDDAHSFHFGSIYEPSDCVKMKFHNSFFEEQSIPVGAACIKYMQKIYQTNDVIITPPNGEGILSLFYAVEMRRVPFIKVEFANKNYIVKLISKTNYSAKFKVFDTKRNTIIKKAEDIQITNAILDAEIYPDEITPPDGWC